MKIINRITLSDSFYTRKDILYLYNNKLIEISDYKNVNNISVKNGIAFLGDKKIDYIYCNKIPKSLTSYFFAKDKNRLIVCSIFLGCDCFCGKNIITYPIDCFSEEYRFKFLT